MGLVGYVEPDANGVGGGENVAGEAIGGLDVPARVTLLVASSYRRRIMSFSSVAEG